MSAQRSVMTVNTVTKTVKELFDALRPYAMDAKMQDLSVRELTDETGAEGIKVTYVGIQCLGNPSLESQEIVLGQQFVHPQDVLAEPETIEPYPTLDETITKAMQSVIERECQPGGLFHLAGVIRTEEIKADEIGEGRPGVPVEKLCAGTGTQPEDWKDEPTKRYPTHEQVSGSSDYQACIVPAEFVIPAGSGPGARVRIGTNQNGDVILAFCDSCGNTLADHRVSGYVVPRVTE